MPVCTIVCPFEPNDSESRLFLGSAWIHRVLVSICLGRGNWCFQFSLISHRICDCKENGRALVALSRVFHSMNTPGCFSAVFILKVGDSVKVPLQGDVSGIAVKAAFFSHIAHIRQVVAESVFRAKVVEMRLLTSSGAFLP